MAKPVGYVGTLSVIWEDGTKHIFEIALNDGRIWIGDHAVSVRNEKSMQGLLTEINDVMGMKQKVRLHTWLELLKPLTYPK
jgi:hypothetical protein